MKEDKKAQIKSTYNKLKATLPKSDKNNIVNINKLKKEFSDIKYYKRKIAIKEEATIVKYLNPNNDFNFQLMNH